MATAWATPLHLHHYFPQTSAGCRHLHPPSLKLCWRWRRIHFFALAVGGGTCAFAAPSCMPAGTAPACPSQRLAWEQQQLSLKTAPISICTHLTVEEEEGGGAFHLSHHFTDRAGMTCMPSVAFSSVPNSLRHLNNFIHPSLCGVGVPCLSKGRNWAGSDLTFMLM